MLVAGQQHGFYKQLIHSICGLLDEQLVGDLWSGSARHRDIPHRGASTPAYALSCVEQARILSNLVINPSIS
jgi:hypothetical protein